MEKEGTHLPDPRLYAERIGLGWPLTPDLETLDSIVLHNQLNVPFENMQCYDAREVPSMSVADIFDKVVVRRRGGYCFELNAILLAFLKDVGFDAWPVSSCILRGRDYIPPMLHRGTVVRIDGQDYYCEVGYGGPQPSFAVPLGGTRTKNGETYSAMRSDGMWWVLERTTSSGETERTIGFWDLPMEESYFVPYNYYCASSADSIFTKERMLNIRTVGGSIAITGRTMREHREGKVIEVSFEDPDELEAAIRSKFGIPVPAGVLRF